MIAAWFAANLTRVIVYTVVAVVVLGAVFFAGYAEGEKKLFEYKAEQAAATVALVVKQGEVTERVVTRFIKVEADSRTVEEAVKRGVEAYAATNAGYCLDAAWGGLHDRAARNAVSDPGPPADAPLRAPTAAGAIETVTFNYAACHRTADRLDALQEWVRAQRALAAKKSPE